MRIDRARLKQSARVIVRITPEETDHRKEFEDSEAVDWIDRQLEADNPWAWCTVKVTVHWRDWEESDWLSGCSYESEEAFVNDDGNGYYSSMVNDCINTIAKRLEDLVADHDIWEHEWASCMLCIADASP